jgi:tetratricopeptide (TPR) repeat protein
VNSFTRFGPWCHEFCTRAYERALELIPEVGYRWGEAVVQFELGDVMRLQGNYGLARDLIERGLAVAREIGDSLEEARAEIYLGRLFVCLGDYARAEQALTRVLQASESLDAPELRVEGLLPLTILARQSGNLEGVLAYAQEADRRQTHPVLHQGGRVAMA